MLWSYSTHQETESLKAYPGSKGAPFTGNLSSKHTHMYQCLAIRETMKCDLYIDKQSTLSQTTHTDRQHMWTMVWRHLHDQNMVAQPSEETITGSDQNQTWKQCYIATIMHYSYGVKTDRRWKWNEWVHANDEMWSPMSPMTHEHEQQRHLPIYLSIPRSAPCEASAHKKRRIDKIMPQTTTEQQMM